MLQSDLPHLQLLLHLSPLCSLLPIAVWGSRAYAVFNRSKIILVIFGSLELLVLALSVVRIVSSFLLHVFEWFNFNFY